MFDSKRMYVVCTQNMETVYGMIVNEWNHFMIDELHENSALQWVVQSGEKTEWVFWCAVQTSFGLIIISVL